MAAELPDETELHVFHSDQREKRRIFLVDHWKHPNYKMRSDSLMTVGQASSI